MSELLKINVNDHIEKKNGLSYLSWAWAWAEVLKIDPAATHEVVEYNGLPVCFLPDTSAMVKVRVTIKGHTKECLLPVMDHRNRSIKNPDSFAINTSIMRCLTKTIALHGLGLYVFAGEDLPTAEREERDAELDARLADCANIDDLTALFKSLPEVARTAAVDKFSARKKELI